MPLKLATIKSLKMRNCKIMSNKNLAKQFSWGQFSGGQFSWGAFFRGAFFRWSIFLGGLFPGGIFLGGFFPGGIFPDTKLFKSTLVFMKIFTLILHQTECKRNVAATSFFLLLRMRKCFVYWHFPEMSMPLKNRNHFNFSAPNKCRFFETNHFCIFI